MGQSRSVTMIQSYLIRNEGMSLLQVCELFQEREILTKLNPGMLPICFVHLTLTGFQRQLMEFEKKITGASTKDFFTLGTRTRKSPSYFSPPLSRATPRTPRSNTPRATPSSTSKSGAKTKSEEAIDTPYKPTMKRSEGLVKSEGGIAPRTPLAPLHTNRHTITPQVKRENKEEEKERLKLISESLLRMLKGSEGEGEDLLPEAEGENSNLVF